MAERRNSGRRRRAQVPGALAALLLLLLLLLLSLTVVATRGLFRQGDCDRRRASMVTLPPAPALDRDLLKSLFAHLTLPAAKPCRRELGLGGAPVDLDGRRAEMAGVKWTCLDPGLSLARPRCLVVASRPPQDASFDEAAVQFGCEVHSFGPDLPAPLPGRLHAQAELQLDLLPGEPRPVSFLALALPAGELAALLEAPPEPLARRVEQLSVRLDLSQALGGGRVVDVALMRRLYEGLLRLQALGFHPFSSTVVKGEEVAEFEVPGLEERVGVKLEVSWMKVLCDG